MTTKIDNKRDTGYDFIRFFATLLIVIHHFYTTCRDLKIVTNENVKYIINHGATGFGGVGVALFFILSGAVLWMTNKNISIIDFLKKRFTRICIPQWIGFVSAALLTIAAGREIDCDFWGGIISFLGLNYAGAFWKQFDIKTVWLIGEWFTAVIILLYVLFPLLRWAFAKHRIISTIIITTIFLLNLKFQILTYRGGWFSITNGLMFLWLGMLFEEYKDIICNKKVLIPLAIFAIAFWYLNPRELFGFKYLSCFVFSISLFILLYQVKLTSKFIQYISKYNYEIYLVHHRIYIILIPALLKANHVNDFQILLAFVFLTGIVFLLSEQLQKLSNFIIKKIQNVLQDQKRKKTNV